MFRLVKVRLGHMRLEKFRLVYVILGLMRFEKLRFKEEVLKDVLKVIQIRLLLKLKNLILAIRKKCLNLLF